MTADSPSGHLQISVAHQRGRQMSSTIELPALLVHVMLDVDSLGFCPSFACRVVVKLPWTTLVH